MSGYTKGIRKLFFDKTGGTQQGAAKRALEAGYKLMLWNGKIYRVGEWVIEGEKTVLETGLVLEDFEF